MFIHLSVTEVKRHSPKTEPIKNISSKHLPHAYIYTATITEASMYHHTPHTVGIF